MGIMNILDNIIKAFVFYSGVAILVGIGLGFVVGNIVGKDTTKREAVKVGVAHYTSNNEGRSIFSWNTNAINVLTNK